MVLRNASELETTEFERIRADETLLRATDVISAVSDAALRRLSERDLFVNLCARVKELFDTDTASILLADESRQELFVAASVGLAKAEVEAKIRVPFGRGVAGTIFSSGAPRMIPDLSKVDPVCNLLLVDDDRDIRETLAGYLRSQAHRVRVAANGEEGSAARWPTHVSRRRGRPRLDEHSPRRCWPRTCCSTSCCRNRKRPGNRSCTRPG